ncbi:MAG: hypothetical protein ABW003_29975, partial [Microvirga sp.]
IKFRAQRNIVIISHSHIRISPRQIKPHHRRSHPARSGPDTAYAAGGWVQAVEVPAAGQGRAKEKLDGFCSVIEEALAIAAKDLDRLILRELMNRVTARRGRNLLWPALACDSSLPQSQALPHR